MPVQRKSLGKGLGALLPAPRFSPHDDAFFLCPLEHLEADPDQPRQHFDDAALGELVASIREKGILQPLVVRRAGEDRYMVVAGERRLRAAHRAGLAEVPVLVKEVASGEALELALIENLQRQDLNPVEEALAYQRLLEQPDLTQETLARRLGRDRSTIANALRLLRLAREHQQHIVDGTLTAGHARALLSLERPEAREALAKRVLDQGLNVRQAEAEARRLKQAEASPARPPRRPRGAALQPYCDGVARELSEALGAPVTVKARGRRGQVIIEFAGVDALRSLRDRLTG